MYNPTFPRLANRAMYAQVKEQNDFSLSLRRCFNVLNSKVAWTATPDQSYVVARLPHRGHSPTLVEPTPLPVEPVDP